MSSSSEGGRGGGGERKGSFNKSNTLNVLPCCSPLAMCLYLSFIQPATHGCMLGLERITVLEATTIAARADSRHQSFTELGMCAMNNRSCCYELLG